MCIKRTLFLESIKNSPLLLVYSYSDWDCTCWSKNMNPKNQRKKKKRNRGKIHPNYNYIFHAAQNAQKVKANPMDYLTTLGKIQVGSVETPRIGKDSEDCFSILPYARFDRFSTVIKPLKLGYWLRLAIWFIKPGPNSSSSYLFLYLLFPYSFTPSPHSCSYEFC